MKREEPNYWSTMFLITNVSLVSIILVVAIEPWTYLFLHPNHLINLTKRHILPDVPIIISFPLEHTLRKGTSEKQAES